MIRLFLMFLLLFSATARPAMTAGWGANLPYLTFPPSADAPPASPPVPVQPTQDSKR